MKNPFICLWSSWCFFGLVLFVIISLSVRVTADEADSRMINWAYQTSLGDGFSIGAQEKVRILKIPFSYTFKGFTSIDWALKLKFPLTIGFYNVEVENQDLELDILALVPGLELYIPLRDNWFLIPLVNMGLGKDTSGGNLRYLYSTGIKHQVHFDWKQFDCTFGNTLRRDGYFSDGDSGSDNVTQFSTGLDVRFPLGIPLLKHPGYLSLYGVNYYYFEEITVLDIDSNSVELDMQWELGLTLSTIPNWKILRFPIERVGLGYRFGDGFSAIRLVFGMPF